MHPTISDAFSRARVAELHADAPRHGSRPARRRLSFRYAEARDRAALDRLAALDTAEPLATPLLVAELDDTVVAAIDVAGEVIADPFVPTSRLVKTLRALHGDAPRGLGGRIRAALAWQ
jgi:hypothetical protein